MTDTETIIGLNKSQVKEAIACIERSIANLQITKESLDEFFGLKPADAPLMTADPELLSIYVEMKKLLGDALGNSPHYEDRIIIPKQDAEEMHERLRQITLKARGETDG